MPQIHCQQTGYPAYQNPDRKNYDINIFIQSGVNQGRVLSMSTILIVDDDPDIVSIFEIFLTSDGHTTITASDGEMCLEKLQKIHPDLILLDLIMQPMDGWATLTTIKSNPETGSIPVIMISGKQMEERECEKYGSLFYDYLMKPIRRAQLCEAVRSALNRQ